MDESPKIVIITQARMQSTRLPGKIMLEAGGKPLLAWHIQRLQQTGYPVMVATSTLGAEAPILDFCEANGIPCFRGDEQDVLSRFYHAAKEMNAEAVVRVTSDCPLIDPDVITAGITRYLELNNPKAFVSNTLDRTYPRGFDFEIFSFQALEEAHLNAQSEGQREHVTPYIWRDHPDQFPQFQITRPVDASMFRLTVNTPRDFDLIKELISAFDAGTLSGDEIISILQIHPELAAINQDISQKKTQK